jgi:hypothetical protein
MGRVSRSLFVVVSVLYLSTIAEAAQAWDQRIEGANRFTVLKDWNSEAVLDKETGLGGERSPSLTRASTWYGGYNICLGKVVAGRMGWHLPTFEELASLVATTSLGPELPTVHPFNNVPGEFLTATTHLTDPSHALTIAFGGSTHARPKSDPDPARVWCVRGGQGFEGR